MLEELVERIEKLEGPDREVDAEIALALEFPNWRDRMLPARITKKASHTYSALTPDGVGGSKRVPAFTASLDAAMTLVPEGAHWGIGHEDMGPLVGWAWVRAKNDTGWQEYHSPPRLGFRHIAPFPATPALALCAAALRALAKEE